MSFDEYGYYCGELSKQSVRNKYGHYLFLPVGGYAIHYNAIVQKDDIYYDKYICKWTKFLHHHWGLRVSYLVRKSVNSIFIDM